MSGHTSELVVARRSDNIRTGLILALLAAAFFFGFIAKFFL
jgi:hypothetical protein